ncbi:M18 family aminopeptidase [Marinifilum caeruleilacunae]|jgi:aspartyl aminopeptidase|uniref:M18 family aminopeptidase n=1 Tax=Marinifilum caeruleilacunae TaxID=2499076 RepID=A0ABX1WY24_9BACT|nr:M18 family aminopeptidase [Marinifilum caeruleilacunae]NOU60969.1 M18 family aminopeptidase [Marinifilum caeruleilacunae]
MSNSKQQAQELIDFIHGSPSTYHAVNNIRKELNEAGFQELDLREEWAVEKGGKYFTSKNGSAIFAFQIGTGEIEEEGFQMICAHSDAPGFKIKPNPEIEVEGNYIKLNTEVYGGPILNTWMDRPLSIAGRVSVKSNDPLHPEHLYVKIDRPLMVIPNLAIHLNRAVNDGVELNKQKDMLPLLSMITEEMEKDNCLVKLIANELKIDAESIIDFDVNLFEVEKGAIFGLNDEFISSPRLDDLAMAHAGLQALLSAGNSKKTQMLAIFDNEEVGSVTKQGAGSPVLRHILQRIVFKLGKDMEALHRAIYNSFMISADMAHAVHPNIGEKHDPTNRPFINKGPVIKIHANQKYTTDGDSGTVFETLCKNADVPYQKFVNRSDLVGGSTLGNVSTGQVDIRTVDIGNPMFGMHSVRETGGVEDNAYVRKVFSYFFGL